VPPYFAPFIPLDTPPPFLPTPTVYIVDLYHVHTPDTRWSIYPLLRSYTQRPRVLTYDYIQCTAMKCMTVTVNLKKCLFFLLVLDFFGHHISAHGIEVHTSKVDHM
jgi:hypothetical protein